MQRQRLIAPIIKTAYLFHHIPGQNFNRTHYKKGGQKIQTDPPVPGPAPCKLQYPRKLLRGSHKPVNQQHYHTISDQKRCIHIPVIHKPFGQNDPGVLDQKSQKRYQREHHRIGRNTIWNCFRLCFLLRIHSLFHLGIRMCGESGSYSFFLNNIVTILFECW